MVGTRMEGALIRFANFNDAHMKDCTGCPIDQARTAGREPPSPASRLSSSWQRCRPAPPSPTTHRRRRPRGNPHRGDRSASPPERRPTRSPCARCHGEDASKLRPRRGPAPDRALLRPAGRRRAESALHAGRRRLLSNPSKRARSASTSATCLPGRELSIDQIWSIQAYGVAPQMSRCPRASTPAGALSPAARK